MTTEFQYEDLIGHTMKSVTDTGDELVFVREDGKKFKFFHEQDCCEAVRVEEIVGDLDDLIGSPIVQAEEVTDEEYEKAHSDDCSDSYSWTFYKFATNKGSVTVRWLGQSNGYYSEDVSFGACR
jgi:hypothetical protein